MTGKGNRPDAETVLCGLALLVFVPAVVCKSLSLMLVACALAIGVHVVGFVKAVKS